MKKPSLFKLSMEAVGHLDAAIAYFKNAGHKATKTDLVERAIFTIPTNDDQQNEGRRSDRSKPVPPLLSAFRSWRNGQPLSRSQMLFLSEAAHAAIKQNQGFYNHEYVADLLRAFKAVLTVKPKARFSEETNSLTSYYLSNLVEKREGGLDASLNATITRIMEPTFAGSADFPARNLVVALRDEPPLDENKLNSELAPYLNTIFKLAIRQNWVETGNLFLDPDQAEPSGSEYWSKIHKSKHFEIDQFSLNWNADHKTAGGMLSSRTDSLNFTIELRSFPALCDFFALIQNLSRGGPGGTREGITLEKNPGLGEPEGGAQLVIGREMARVSFWLSENQLQALLELGRLVLSDSEVTSASDRLCWVYGDI